jgi:tetratricopeptide (TPR) repeat protein
VRRLLCGDLDTIVGKALKKTPDERYPSVAALADDLRRHLAHQPIAARPDTFAYRAGKFARRNRTAVALAAVAFATSVAGIAGTMLQARAARAERDFAIRQLSRAEAINDLNNFLLTDAAPSGKPLSVTDLLSRAEHVVARQRDKRDPDRIDILISIGRQYATLDEHASSRRLLSEAYELSRDSADPSIRAKASCAWGNALARTGEPERAEALIQEGLGELGEGSQYALDRVFCLLRGSEVARETGDGAQGIARVEAAQRALSEWPLRSGILEMRTLMDLGEAYRQAGRAADAVAVFERTSSLLTELGRDDTQVAGTLLNNWAIALNFLGRPADAERIYRRAIDISRTDETEAAVSPMLLINYARALLELGRANEAKDYAERGRAKALDVGDEVIINQSLLISIAIDVARGDAALGAAHLAEVEPRLRRDLPAGHIAFASLTFYKALVAQARGDLPAALDSISAAIAMAEANTAGGGQGADYIPTFLVRRAGIEIALARFDDASADAARALKLVQDAAPPGMLLSTLGRAYLALARALEGQGRQQEARAAARSALEHLKDAVGSEHSDTRAAGQLADRTPIAPAGGAR